MGLISQRSQKILVVVNTIAILGSFSVTTANATNGYFSHGYGASSKGLAGAGVALSLDSMAAATNPAAMVSVGTRADIEVGAFMPDRKVTGDGTVNGSYRSENKLFLIPQFGVNHMINENSSIGFTMSANGGMNTEYKENPFVGFGAGTVTGIGGNQGPAGVDLAQSLMGVTYARRYGIHSFGITPTLAVQRFKAYGLQGYERISSAPLKLHGNGYDYSVGYGARFGYQGTILENLTVGAAFATKMRMQRFDKYEGLFADGGSFDIPANITLGAAYKEPNTGITFTADWQFINYDDVDSVSNSGNTNFNQACLGSRQLGGSDGCGFGWEDQHIIKLGVQYMPFENWTIRAGVSHNTQVYNNGESLFNILAPAVIRNHLSFGSTYTFSDAHTINLAYTRAFEEDQVGSHENQQAGKVVHHIMDQHDIVIGYTYKW